MHYRLDPNYKYSAVQLYCMYMYMNKQGVTYSPALYNKILMCSRAAECIPWQYLPFLGWACKQGRPELHINNIAGVTRHGNDGTDHFVHYLSESGCHSLDNLI